MRVHAVCAAPKVLESVAAQHGPVRPPATMGCRPKRRLVRIVPPIYGLWHCFTHANCICNDVIACRNRVVGEVPLPTAVGVLMLRKIALEFQRKVGVQVPLTLEEALSTFKGTKRRLYEKAYQSLRVEPLSYKDGKIKAFVKAEKLNPADKENPDPRMIQARDPRYNIHIARYLRPVEHIIYGYRINGLRSVAKCLNPRQRAELLAQKWAMFDDPVCFTLDCSRWDKHISLDVLLVEHDFYKSCYPGDHLLTWLLKRQCNNVCSTSNGLRYSVVGGRMSGDLNTALGNCFLMLCMVKAAMRHLVVKQYQVLDDGDDCLILVERSELESLRANLPRVFLEFGQELKIENVAYDIHNVIFCQARYTWNGDHYVFARSWKKVLSQACCGTKHWNDHNMVRKMFGLLGDCELAQHAGIPILQVYAERLRELSGGQRAKLIHLDSSYQYRVGSYGLDLQHVTSREITWRARLEFELSWGVDISTQLHIESKIRAWNPDIYCRDVNDVLSSEDWTQYLDPTIPNPTVL